MKKWVFDWERSASSSVENPGFKGKPLIFFFFYDGFRETWAKICGFTCSGGWKLETNGGFIETGGFGDVQGRRPWTSPKSPSFNEYHHWFSSFHTPRTREYRKVLPKLHWIPSYKNKINMSVFPLKPSFSHFSISFLLWIPSKSISPDNRTVARQPVDLSREVRFTYF